MTGTAISNMQGVMPNFTSNSAKNTGLELEASQGSFQEVLGKQTVQAKASDTKDQNSIVKNTDNKKTDTRETDKGEETKDTSINKNTGKKADKVEKQTEKELETEDAAFEENAEEIAEKVMEAALTIVKELAGALDVTIEDVEKALEELGVSLQDILQTGNISQVILQVSGENDMLAMTTNEDLYQAFKEITQMVETTLEDLAGELNVGVEELQTAIQSIMKGNGSLPDDPFLAQLQQIMAEDMPKEMGESEKMDTSIYGNQDTETHTMDGILDEEHLQDTQTKAQIAGADVNDQNGRNTQNGGSDAPRSYDQVVHNETIQQVPFDTRLLSESAKAPIESYFSPETRNIMDQIMNSMRVQAGDNLTEIQMQLQPETLGNLHIHIASKEGVVTAQFTAETESVKSVLESQVVLLRENLEQQGIKVEAVEVTLASHQFERNLEQGGQEQQQPGQESKHRRSLNLEDLDLEEISELDEAERIQVEMMEQNGNTVDYIA